MANEFRRTVKVNGINWVAGNLAAIERLPLADDDVLAIDLRVDRGVGVWNLDAALIFKRAEMFSGKQLNAAVDYFESIGFPRSFTQLTLEQYSTDWRQCKGPKVLAAVGDSPRLDGEPDLCHSIIATTVQRLKMEHPIVKAQPWLRELSTVTLQIQPGQDETNMGDISVEEFRVICAVVQAQAKAGDATAQQQWGVISYRGVPEAGISSNHGAAAFWFEKAAQAGLAPAQCNLGLLLLLGHGVPVDNRLGAHWISKAADAGLAPAQNHYGKLFQEGRGVKTKKPLTRAVQYFQKAADQGETNAMVNLAAAHIDGRGCPKDLAKARSLLTVAASKGDDDAAQLLSRMDKPAQQPTAAERVERRRKVPSAEVQALLAKAEAGDADAQHKLSRMYDEGSGGVEVNPTQALHWLRRAAEAGHMSAQYDLGAIYYSGLCHLQQDYAQAVRWYTRAAEAGNTNAQRHLSTLHFRGDGVPKDERLAAMWMKRAADTGSPEARFAYGKMLQCGSGVEKDEVLAVEYFEKAVAGGDSNAMFRLGIALCEGKGTQRDWRRGRSLVAAAAENNVQGANASLEAIVVHERTKKREVAAALAANLLAKKEAAAEQAAAELLREEDEAARANTKKKTKKKKKKRRGAATAEPDEAKADGPAAAAVDEPEAKEDASPALERLTLADESNVAEETMAPAPADAAESPTIAAPEGAAIAATQRPKKTNLLATWQREREEAATRPVPPAFDSTRRNFVAFLATLDLQHHAQRLMEEQIGSVKDLMMLTGDELSECGIPPPDVERLVREFRKWSAAAEESKSSEAAAPPPPPGKILVDEETYDDAAARAAALETSLTAHQAELKRLKAVLKERGVPDGYLCPISLEVMEDPVIAADGHSYERSDIEAWFNRGNNTSPKTGGALPHQFLTPNHNLRSAIQDFLDEVRKFAEM